MVENMSIFGVYARRAGAEQAVAALRSAGFRNTDISAVLPKKQLPEKKKATGGTVTGAASGAAVGGVLGWLAGISAIAVSGADAFGDTLLGVGPLMGMLAGAGAAGVVGGLVGALAGMGIPAYAAKHYERRIKAGGILLSVHCDDQDWVKRAEAVLHRTGAERISSSIEVLSRFAKSDATVRYSRD